MHLDRTDADVQRWIHEEAGLDAHVAKALLASMTRPRIEQGAEGFLLVLRSVDLNPGADPSDMISLRIWMEPTRLITFQREPLKSVEAVIERCRQPNGPMTLADILVGIVTGLTERIGAVVDALDDQVDELEERVVDPKQTADYLELSAVRQRAVLMHRFIKPQVQALAGLHGVSMDCLTTRHRRAIKEAANRTTRFAEDLDAAKSRAAIIQDELSNQLARVTNQRIYMVTLIAGIFMPLTFIAGLLGANVGGIPGSTSPRGFLYVCLILAAIGTGGFFLARLTKWL